MNYAGKQPIKSVLAYFIVNCVSTWLKNKLYSYLCTEKYTVIISIHVAYESVRNFCANFNKYIVYIDCNVL
jgi:hypothetical protein